MLKPGDVVTVEFPGAQGIKRRPAVVVSSDVYHNTS
jgi:mRNA interferase MazF